MNKNDCYFKGMPVSNVAPGSPADHAGINIGDEIVFCNGQRVQNTVEYFAARALVKGQLALTILRGSKVLDFDFSL